MQLMVSKGHFLNLDPGSGQVCKVRHDDISWPGMGNRKLKYGSLIPHNGHPMTHGKNIMTKIYGLILQTKYFVQKRNARKLVFLLQN